MRTLSLRSPLDAPLDVEGITPDRLAMLAERDIARLPVWVGARDAHLGDFFDVSGTPADHLRIEGDMSRVDGLGAGMAGGHLVVNGSVGHRVGAGMTAGRIEVLGNAGDGAGLAMSGGVLHVRGNAGSRLGAAEPGASKGMTGGEIVVEGSAGSDVAACARRGLVVVAGDVAGGAARAIVAGTVVVLGRTGANPGRGSKRGSIIAAGGITVPPTYQYACTFRPPHVRLTLTYLRRRYALAIDDRVIDGAFNRYCGDAGEPGKGEILELAGD